jgi:hypothetical protein
MIGLDGCFLKGYFGGQLLTAVGKPININGVGLLRRPKNPVFKPVVAVKNVVVSPEHVDPMKAYNNTNETMSMRFMPTPGLSRGARNEGPSS